MASKKYESLIQKVNEKIEKFNAGKERFVGDYQKIEVGDCFIQEQVDADFDAGRGCWVGGTYENRMKLVEKNNKYYFAFCNNQWEMNEEDKWMDLLDKEEGFTAKTLFEYLIDEDAPWWNRKKCD